MSPAEEGGKPSSLRGRVERRQKGLSKGPSLGKVLVIIFGVIVAGVAIFFAFK